MFRNFSLIAKIPARSKKKYIYHYVSVNILYVQNMSS